MGPTSSGKSTIAQLLADTLRCDDVPAIHFDGNVVRSFFGPNLGFTREDRLRGATTCVRLANMVADAGLNVVVSALTANNDARDFVNKNIPNLTLVYLDCPIEICIERDSLGLYRKAKTGEIDPKTLIGLTEPYPPPPNPDITLRTDKLSPEESVARLRSWLTDAGYDVGS